MSALVEILCYAHEFGVVHEVPHLHLYLYCILVRAFKHIAQIVESNFTFSRRKSLALLLILPTTARHYIHLHFLLFPMLTCYGLNLRKFGQRVRLANFFVADEYEF